MEYDPLHEIWSIQARIVTKIILKSEVNSHGPAHEIVKRKEASGSFLKKRTKKLLFVFRRAGFICMVSGQKFFGSFFQKRTAFFTIP